VCRGLGRALHDPHAAGEVPDVVGALGPPRCLRGADRDLLPRIRRGHLDASRFRDRRREPAGRQRRQRAGGGGLTERTVDGRTVVALREAAARQREHDADRQHDGAHASGRPARDAAARRAVIPT